MKKTFLFVAAVIVISASAFTVVNNTYRLKDENYAVKFVTSKFDGVFKGLKTDIVFDENNLNGSRIKASIEANTVNTGNGMRNKHAMQGLSADQYANITFESTQISKTSSGYEALGKLTIKDVTKEIRLPFTFSKTADGGVFDGSFQVIPSDYNIDKSGTPESFNIQLNVPVIR